MVEADFIERSVKLSTNAKWLYVCLRFRKNNGSGQAWPSYDDLIKLTGFKSRSTLSSAIKELEASGWIIARHRFGQSTIYMFAISTVVCTTDTNTTNNTILVQTTDTPLVQTTDTLLDDITKRREQKNKSGASAPAHTPEPAPVSTPKKPKPAKLPAAFMDHPAVVMYRDLCHITPNEIQRQLIAEHNPELPRWELSIKEWMAHGWNKANVPGMLERYESPPAPRTNGNGAHEPVGFAAIREAMADPKYQEVK